MKISISELFTIFHIDHGVCELEESIALEAQFPLSSKAGRMNHVLSALNIMRAVPAEMQEPAWQMSEVERILILHIMCLCIFSAICIDGPDNIHLGLITRRKIYMCSGGDRSNDQSHKLNRRLSLVTVSLSRWDFL